MLIAYHGKPEVKSLYVERVKLHAAADEIIHGKYWEDGKGCAVGCTIHSGDHAAYETELGIPQILARLEDHIFEGMANGNSKKFPLRFLSAIPVGADLSLVWPRFAVWLLIDEKHGVVRHTKKDSAQYVAIHRVAELYQRTINGYDVSKLEFQDARRSATTAAAYAATTAAAYAATTAAAYAAAATAATTAATTARQKSFKAQADKLVELLAEAPVPAAHGSDAKQAA